MGGRIMNFHEHSAWINEIYLENPLTTFYYTGQKWNSEPVTITHITPYWGEYLSEKGERFAGELFNLRKQWN
jgi:hypothetical protein